jgi:phosphopantetheinyl transferase
MDITQIAPICPPFPAFEGVFDKSIEFRWMASASSDWEKSKRFSILWALKEAYVKCTGQGITIDLCQIVFHITPQETGLEAHRMVDCWDKDVDFTAWTIQLHVSRELVPGWTFKVWMLNHDHVVAIALDQVNVVIPEVEWPLFKTHIIPTIQMIK